MSYKTPQIHRSDSNQSPLVKRFMALGGLWIPYANKPFDGWAFYPRFGYMPVEIKKPERRNHADRYTDRQRKVMRTLQIAGATWLEWETEDDVVRAVSAVTATSSLLPSPLTPRSMAGVLFEES